MKRKADCEECEKTYTAARLHRSIEDHRFLCYVCWRRECNIRNKRKLSVLMKKERKTMKSTTKVKKSSRVSRLLKYGVKLFSGEESLLNK